MTINELFEKVWAEHWNTPRYDRSGWAREAWNNYRRLIAPKFGGLSHEAIKASQVREWHRELAATPTQANRALAVFSKLFSFAEEKEWRAQGANPCGLVKPHKERKRKRFATLEEIKKVSEILDREAARRPNAVAFLYAMMFSGARPRSIERSTWNNLTTVQYENQTFGVLTFSGKSSEATGEDEQVILPPQAMAHIEMLRPITREGANNTGLIFRIKMPKDFWNMVRKEAGCEDLWARDLRRTFATVGMSNGLTGGVIGELLNHKSAETTKIYTQLMNDKKLEAVKAIATEIDRIVKKA